ncbi:hypothetical protein F53441_7408 [Fusarium austroafricanum]|uniref:Uncharacterized protein n=1 Tax=Fusarium austroafricanum TaxID=2364996 RepID=A0A8H4KDI3_9HYPO|nr:hypothetical protein F53441_7408 [Fusarium austroafricanum]
MRYFTAIAILSLIASVTAAAQTWCPGVLQGPATVKPDTENHCSASVPVIASDYDERVSSASSKYLKGNGDAKTTATKTSGDADATDNSSAINDDSPSQKISDNGAAVVLPTMVVPIAAGMPAYAMM